MKKLILTALLLGATCATFAQEVTLENQPLGSGYGNAVRWDNDVYHAPQYMPGYPTSAVLYPRVIDVDCIQTGKVLKCAGYNWLPALGRGEYLMIRPNVKVEAKPQVITKVEIKEVPVYIEVQKKKKAE